MNVSVIGSRGFPDPEATAEYWLEKIAKPGDRIVSGGARGIDSAFERYAWAKGFEVLSFRPVRASDGRFLVHRHENGADTGPVLDNGFPLSYSSFAEAAKARNWWIQREAESAAAFWDGISSGTAHGIAAAVRFHRSPSIVMPGDS